MNKKNILAVLNSAADPALATSQYERFCAVFDRTFGAEPVFDDGASHFLRLFGNTFLAERLCNHPEWIKNGSELSREKLRVALDQKLSSDAQSKDFLQSIREFKYKIFATIAASELAGSQSENEILASWSNLADVIIDVAYEEATKIITKKFGTISLDGQPSFGAILGLGKLGSRELNFSSDIDILVIYDSDLAFAEQNGKRTTANEFYSAVARELTKILSAVTEHGFAFRVDHDLRPEGRSGALANSIDAMERYYQYFGRNWERQMLIRARHVAGAEAVANSFLTMIKPFVFPKSMSRADFLHLRDMKERIEREALSSRSSLNIKLCKGGIRELEFYVQAHLQLYGGARPTLRTTNTFEAIQLLGKEGFIHPSTTKRLTEAYSFLRRTENALQVADDAQTHSLPDSSAGTDALARRLSSSTETFKAQLSVNLAFVEKMFSTLFAVDYEFEELLEAATYNISLAETDEERADSLAWFKMTEQRRLLALWNSDKISLEVLLKQLSLIAEATVVQATKIASNGLKARFGLPRLDSGEKANFAVCAMGRFGSREMDFHSDLDVIFIYDGDGKTDGAKSISNREYFTLLGQRIISLVSLHTRYGKAYEIDSELRPSGRSGALVTSLDGFLEHHAHSTDFWEQMALTRFRPVAVVDDERQFLDRIDSTVKELALNKPLPSKENAFSEFIKLRKKVFAERAPKSPNIFSARFSAGTLYDIESLVQISAIYAARQFPSVYCGNTFEAILRLKDEGIEIENIFSYAEANDVYHPEAQELYNMEATKRCHPEAQASSHIETCRSCHPEAQPKDLSFSTAEGRKRDIYASLFFFRKLILAVRLISGRSIDELNFSSDLAAKIAEAFGLGNADELRREIEKHKFTLDLQK